MLISKNIFHSLALMGLIASLEVSFLQGMISENSNDPGCDTLTQMLQSLTIMDKPLNISPGEQLFAERFIQALHINQITGVEDYYEKKNMMQGFLDKVSALRDGEYKYVFNDMCKIVNGLCKNSLNSLILHYQQNENKQADLNNILTNVAQESLNERSIGTMTLACQQEYNALGDANEETFTNILDNIIKKNRFGDSTAKALLIEALTICDEGFRGWDAEYKNSLSIADLKELLWDVCGYHTTDIEKFFMALSGAEESGFAIIEGFVSLAKVDVFIFIASFFVYFVVSGWWSIASQSGPFYSTNPSAPMIAALCTAGVVLFLCLGRNCSHYWMTKKI